jgi:hypothetical protein
MFDLVHMYHDTIGILCFEEFRMTNDELLSAFESVTIPAASLTHATHVRLAYCYLERFPFLEACIAMRNGLKNFAARIDRSGLYHETITIAFMSLVNERMQRDWSDEWLAFAAANPELFDRALLKRYYDDEILASDTAREVFVLGRATVSPGDLAP